MVWLSSFTDPLFNCTVRTVLYTCYSCIVHRSHSCFEECLFVCIVGWLCVQCPTFKLAMSLLANIILRGPKQIHYSFLYVALLLSEPGLHFLDFHLLTQTTTIWSIKTIVLYVFEVTQNFNSFVSQVHTTTLYLASTAAHHRTHAHARILSCPPGDQSGY